MVHFECDSDTDATLSETSSEKEKRSPFLLVFDALLNDDWILLGLGNLFGVGKVKDQLLVRWKRR